MPRKSSDDPYFCREHLLSGGTVALTPRLISVMKKGFFIIEESDDFSTT